MARESAEGDANPGRISERKGARNGKTSSWHGKKSRDTRTVPVAFEPRRVAPGDFAIANRSHESSGKIEILLDSSGTKKDQEVRSSGGCCLTLS